MARILADLLIRIIRIIRIRILVKIYNKISKLISFNDLKLRFGLVNSRS